MEDSKAKTNLQAEVAVARPNPVQSGHDSVESRRPAISLKEQKEQLREGKIVGLHCNGCGYERVSPMTRCSKCKGGDISTRQFSSNGKVVSYTIQSVASEQFLNETPFAFAVIQLDDGPMISGWIPWIAKPKDLGTGQKVEYISSYKPGMMFEKR